MSALPSITSAFALALASQTESVGATRLDQSPPGQSTKPGVTTLLATLDPTRAAFASALLRIDVDNAPEVAGPYVPGTAAGPLTEDDIFDPSQLYSLPGQSLVVFDGTTSANGRANIGASSVPGDDASTRLTSSLDAGAPGVLAFDNKVDLALPAARTPLDVMVTHLDPRPPALTLELAVASYISLMRVGLSPTRRKLRRKLKSRESSRDADQSFSDIRELIEADRRASDVAPL